jgi:hypothetical protein
MLFFGFSRRDNSALKGDAIGQINEVSGLVTVDLPCAVPPMISR